MNKKGKWLVFGLLIFLAAVTGSGQGQTTEAAAWPAPTGNGNALYMEGIFVRLPTESASIQTAGNYYTRLKAAHYTQGARGNQYTAASFNLEACDDGCGEYLLVSVGLLATRNQVRWFVYGANWSGSKFAGPECLRGAQVWTPSDSSPSGGCLGDNKGIVGLNTWHGVRFVKKNGYWDIRVEDRDRKSYLVARAKSSAHRSSLGTSYLENEPISFSPHGDPVNPALLGGFWTDMPYYRGANGKMQKWPSGALVEWAEASICPSEYALKDQITPNGGSWYTGKAFGDQEGFTCGEPRPELGNAYPLF